MFNTNLRTCDNCGSIRDANDTFCGNCGKSLGIHAYEGNYPTVTDREAKQSRITPISDAIQSIYPPQPSLPSLRSTSNLRYLIVIAVLVTMLIGAGSFELGQVMKGNQQGINGNTTTSIAASTPVPAVLYLENGSDNWKGWNGTEEWYVSSGILRSKGLDYNGSVEPTIVAPYSVEGTNDYAVEAKIKMDGVGNEGCFFISLRGNVSSNSWSGYKGAVCQNQPRIQANNDVIATTLFNVGANWHLYRIEVQGSTIRFFIDGGLILLAEDNRFTTGGQVGLKTFGGQIEVDELKILTF